LTTATVLEFALISPPSPVVVALFYHITCKNSGISLKKQPVNFPNQLPLTFSSPCLIALDKTQETPRFFDIDIGDIMVDDPSLPSPREVHPWVQFHL
jgi:hypothetical protein